MNGRADVRTAVGRDDPVAVREIGQHEQVGRRLHDAEGARTVGLLRRPERRAERQRVHVSREHLVALGRSPRLIRNLAVRGIDDRALAARGIDRLRMLLDVLHVADDDAVPEATEVGLAVRRARRVERLHLLHRAFVEHRGLLRAPGGLTVRTHGGRARSGGRRRKRRTLAGSRLLQPKYDRQHEDGRDERTHGGILCPCYIRAQQDPGGPP